MLAVGRQEWEERQEALTDVRVGDDCGLLSRGVREMEMGCI